MKNLILKRAFVFLLLVGLGLTGCRKEQAYMSNAEIIGYDMRECVCCGGLELVIDGVTPPNGSPFFLISEMPSSFKIGDHPNFPIPVKIDYTINSTGCYGDFVNISRIAYR